MHPMFVKLFLENDADDGLAGGELPRGILRVDPELDQEILFAIMDKAMDRALAALEKALTGVEDVSEQLRRATESLGPLSGHLRGPRVRGIRAARGRLSAPRAVTSRWA